MLHCPFLNNECIGNRCARWDTEEKDCCDLVDVRIRRFLLANQAELNDQQRDARRAAAWARVKACAVAEGFDAQMIERAMTKLNEEPVTPAESE